MPPVNSSTSSSEIDHPGASWPGVAWSLLWVIGWLVILDVGIDWFVCRPAATLPYNPSRLARYFEYGRSVEGKLRLLVPEDPAYTHPVAQAGWLHGRDARIAREPTRAAREGGVLVAFYGMSFSNRVAKALTAIDPRITARNIAGPGAPPNYTYAAMLEDRSRHQADVVVWTILASSLVQMGSLTAQTTFFEQPAPYTFPIFDWKDGRLDRRDPEFFSLAEFRVARDDPERWGRWLDELRQYDQAFDSFLFRGGPLDASVLVRLIRRGWSKRQSRLLGKSILSGNDLSPDAIPGRTLPALARRFALAAAEDGRVPLILMIHNQGWSDRVYRLLKETLSSSGIPYVSTHDIVPAGDPSSFLPDGHFSPELDRKIARRVRDVIAAQLPEKFKD